MPDISMTQQTALRDMDLRNALNTMVANIANRSPYNMVGLRPSWEGQTRLVLSAPGHMSGAIDIQNGNPSTVTVQINLLSSLAQGQRSRVENDMRAEAQANLPAPGTTIQRQVGTTAQPPRQTAAAERTRRDIDWGMVGTVFSDILGTATSSLDAFNQAMGYSVSHQAIQIATETAKGAQTGPGFILGPGKVVEPGAPAPGPTVVNGSSQQDLTTNSQQRFPTVGWVVLGLGGVGLVAFTAWAMSKRSSKKSRKFED